jgi:hypothetical protein
MQRKSWEIVTQPKRVCWGSLLDDLEQLFPLFYGMYLQKTASKSLLEMLQNTPNMLQKISVFTQKFYIEKSELKIYVFDLSKRVLATEKRNEMTEIYQIQIKGLEFMQVMAGNSSKASSNQPL